MVNEILLKFCKDNQKPESQYSKNGILIEKGTELLVIVSSRCSRLNDTPDTDLFYRYISFSEYHKKQSVLGHPVYFNLEIPNNMTTRENPLQINKIKTMKHVEST